MNVAPPSVPPEKPLLRTASLVERLGGLSELSLGNWKPICDLIAGGLVKAVKVLELVKAATEWRLDVAPLLVGGA